MKLCDLHTHSTFSDGTYTPGEICQTAEKVGLQAVALCDHNTVDGLTDFLSAPCATALERIPGAEFSVDYEGKELHLLALYLPTSSFPEVSKCMEIVQKRKEQSNRELIEALRQGGYSVDFDRIREKTVTGKFSRVQIASELMEMGYFSSVREAFDEVLDPKKGYYREPQRLTVWEMLDFIRSIGGVPVLAHPFLNLEEKALETFLPLAKRRGLAGMECYYSTYNEEITKKALEMADAFQLAYSGGSDFHGANKPDIFLGRGKGNLMIPYTWAERLRKFACEL